MKNPLVTTDWLEAHLDSENIVVLDASMAKVIGRVPVEYVQPLYIPGSRRLDLEQEFCDLESDQVHALPTETQFRKAIEKFGLRPSDQIVIYDNQGIYSSPRAWWMLHIMGVENVFVLDGGLPKWIAEGRKTSTDLASLAVTDKSELQIKFCSDLVCDSSEVLENIARKEVAIIDARSPGRFLGKEEEPREGVRKGCIPNSINLPFAEVLDGDCFRSAIELSEIFNGLQLGDARKFVFSCGSGVTACIILLASVIAGYGCQVLYDGSWADWGSDQELPINQD